MSIHLKSLSIPALLALQVCIPSGLLAQSDDPRSPQVEKMRKILWAVHDYAAEYRGKLPRPVHYSEDKKPLLSWRVMILPYMGYDDLFREFRLYEPWDSPHNIRMLKQMPKEYSGPPGSNDLVGHTRLKQFTGKECVAYPKKYDGRMLGGDIGKINGLDGVFNVLALAEAGSLVPWSKPEDFWYDHDLPLPPLGGPFLGGFLAASAAAEIHWIKDSISPHDLRTIISIKDGKPQRLIHIKETELVWSWR